MRSETHNGLDSAMDTPPQSFLNLSPGAKLLYLYLLGRQETSWTYDELERCIGATPSALLANANELDALGVLRYTQGDGGRPPAASPAKLKVIKKLYRLGRVSELPDTLLGERITLKLVWLYLVRVGETLTTPDISKDLGLSWLATYNAVKDLNKLELVETTGKRPLKHKARTGI